MQMSPKNNLILPESNTAAGDMFDVLLINLLRKRPKLYSTVHLGIIFPDLCPDYYRFCRINDTRLKTDNFWMNLMI